MCSYYTVPSFIHTKKMLLHNKQLSTLEILKNREWKVELLTLIALVRLAVFQVTAICILLGFCADFK